MSSSAYSEIARQLARDAVFVEKAARYIRDEGVEEFRESDLAQSLEESIEKTRRFVGAALDDGLFERFERKVCSCGASFALTDHRCDDCDKPLSGETEEWFRVQVAPGDDSDFPVRKPDDETSRTSPRWNHPDVSEFLVASNSLQEHELKRGVDLVATAGLCVFRISGAGSGVDLLRAVMSEFGKPTPRQNLFEGEIKELRPADSSLVGTGDTTGDLGFHVDGTQHETTPRILIFQYITGAKYGARSLFVDVSAALHSFEDTARESIVKAFARLDAARFQKNGMTHDGPMLFRGHDDVVGIRTRFDSVVEVRPAARAAWEALGGQLQDSRFQLNFIPHEGDIIVFDNWRLLHAREEIGGQRQRHHRRVWIDSPRPQIASRRYGITGFSIEQKARLPQV